MIPFRERLLSRKFLVTLLGAVIILLANLKIIPMQDENAWQLIAILLSYLGVEGAVDLAGAWRRGNISISDEFDEEP